jgi:hypothetical protein
MRAASPATTQLAAISSSRTLRELKSRMRLSGSEVMTPALQDRMARELLYKRKYDDFLRGEITAAQLQDELAKEWASFSSTNGYSHYDKERIGHPRIASGPIQAAISRAKSQSDLVNDAGRYPVNPTPWR